MKNLIFATVLFMLLVMPIAVHATAMTVNATLPANSTLYSTWPKMMVGTYNGTGHFTTAENCSYFYGYNATVVTDTLDPQNSSNFTWTNNTTLGESGAGQWSNITFACHDGATLSWMNTSNTTGFILFGYDATAPVISAYTIKGLNESKPYLNITFKLAENNLDRIWFKVINSAGNQNTYFVTNNTTGVWNKTYIYRATGLEVDNINGYFIIEVGANDTYGNAATKYNRTALTYLWTAGYWNLVGTFGNETLLEICNRGVNTTYISYYNNSYGYHNFTTHQCGTSANNATVANDGNGVYVATAATVQVFNINASNFSAAPKVNISINGTATESPWNIIGIYARAGKLASQICTANSNITYVTYHLTSNNTYITHHCGWDINNVTIPTGMAVWAKAGNSSEKWWNEFNT